MNLQRYHTTSAQLITLILFIFHNYLIFNQCKVVSIIGQISLVRIKKVINYKKVHMILIR